MSAQSEHPTNGNILKAGQQSKDIEAQIHELLKDCDVLDSKPEKHIFKYAYLFFWGCYFLFILQSFIHLLLLHKNNQLMDNFIWSRTLLLIVVGISLILWSFNAWRRDVPITLQDIVEHNRITKTKRVGDVNRQYLDSLRHYLENLRSPKRYLLIGSLVVLIAAFYSYENRSPILYLTTSPRIVEIIFTVWYLLLIALIYFGLMYCIGIMLWTLYISGRLIRKLWHEFEFRIDPAHIDKCGGLQWLGKFCFGLESPILIGSLFFIGYIFTASRGTTGEYDLASVGLIFIVILLYSLPLTIIVFLLPLRNIHMTMLSVHETNEKTHAESTALIREQIQVFLKSNQWEKAQAEREKMKLIKEVYIPYPTWPFIVKKKPLSALLEAAGSLILGVVTASVPPLLQVIQQSISHKP